jgi:hypothetical protein
MSFFWQNPCETHGDSIEETPPPPASGAEATTAPRSGSAPSRPSRRGRLRSTPATRRTIGQLHRPIICPVMDDAHPSPTHSLVIIRHDSPLWPLILLASPLALCLCFLLRCGSSSCMASLPPWPLHPLPPLPCRSAGNALASVKERAGSFSQDDVPPWPCQAGHDCYRRDRWK